MYEKRLVNLLWLTGEFTRNRRKVKNKGGICVYNFERMLKRVHIQQLRSFLADGIGLDNWLEDEDKRPLEQRKEEEERPIWELLEQTFPDWKALDDAAEKLNRALVVNQDIFMETGLRAGAILLFELLRENPAGERGSEK